MKRGIFLVANYKSQNLCENLIYSIRQSGCTLPIRLIHFGGKKIQSRIILEQVEFLEAEYFSHESKTFISNLQSVLTDCPTGFLYRFLPLFSDWEEFIYSDNDVVALMDWEKLFVYLSTNDLVHADQEYLTEGCFNYDKPEDIKQTFGEKSLERAFTAGHFIAKRSEKLIKDINKAVEWFKKNPGIPKKHDQALLHIAVLLGNWNTLNLCRPPHNWLSSWAGDYKNTLQLILKISKCNKKYCISHLHYSGKEPDGSASIDELLYSYQNEKRRLKKVSLVFVTQFSGLSFLKRKLRNVQHRFKGLLK